MEMTANAANLRELHELHQRAKALRDKIESDPKTLATRESILGKRKATVEAARKALQEARVHTKSQEKLLQSLQGKSDDLLVKLNQARKNEEYKAIQNQIAHEKSAISKVEDDILMTLTKIDEDGVSLAKLEAELKTTESDVAALRDRLSSQADQQKSLLKSLEQSIAGAEAIIPADQRERYARTVKQLGADALAAVENGACSGCYVAVTSQAVNELINCEKLVYCMTCGRVLYLVAEEPTEVRTRRK